MEVVVLPEDETEARKALLFALVCRLGAISDPPAPIWPGDSISFTVKKLDGTERFVEFHTEGAPALRRGRS